MGSSRTTAANVKRLFTEQAYSHRELYLFEKRKFKKEQGSIVLFGSRNLRKVKIAERESISKNSDYVIICKI